MCGRGRQWCFDYRGRWGCTLPKPTHTRKTSLPLLLSSKRKTKQCVSRFTAIAACCRRRMLVSVVVTSTGSALNLTRCVPKQMKSVTRGNTLKPWPPRSAR
eukprot:PhF_6_TR25093/c0_g1_i2/m.34465